MLSEKSRPIIEQTIGVIAERIPAITPEFYKSMFNARPDLLDGMFSRSNQKNGTQPQALAGSIAAFASHLLKNPDSYPDEVLSRVAHKHTSLGLLPEEYPTVHEHLFGAIAADLGDAATPEVVAAWDEVYWLMADALIKLEKGLYGQQANDVMFAPFKLISKEEIAKGVIAFEFEPADDTPLTRPIPGQYVTIQVKVKDGIRQPRQFTLVPSQEGHRRVVIRKDPQGEVTPILHEDINEGDILEISNPYGDVVLDEGHGNLVLASAGIGTTPIVAFLDKLAKEQSQRKVTVLHADHSKDRWPGRQIMERLVDSLSNAQLITWMETPGDGDHEGFMNLADIDLDVDEDTNAFMCGPLPFMKGLRSQLIEKGMRGRNIHYEIFGPDQWMLHDEARMADS